FAQVRERARSVAGRFGVAPLGGESRFDVTFGARRVSPAEIHDGKGLVVGADSAEVRSRVGVSCGGIQVVDQGQGSCAVFAEALALTNEEGRQILDGAELGRFPVGE